MIMKTSLKVIFTFIFLSSCALNNENIFKKYHDRQIGKLVFYTDDSDANFYQSAFFYSYKHTILGSPKGDDTVSSDTLVAKTENGDYYLNAQEVLDVDNNIQVWRFVRGECRYSYFVEKKTYMLKEWKYDSLPQHCVYEPATACILYICP